jgi:hypothetical protein
MITVNNAMSLEQADKRHKKLVKRLIDDLHTIVRTIAGKLFFGAIMAYERRMEIISPH